MGSAHDPLLPLQRWIQYTQTELQQVRAELTHRCDEDTAVRRIQQAQLDPLQVQIRDLARQQFEDQVTEIANTIAELFHQVSTIRQTVNQTMSDVLRHVDSPPVLPPTQLAATQPEFHAS